jgi:hypothetical protein
VFDRPARGERAIRRLAVLGDRVEVAERTSVRADADEPEGTRYAVGHWTGGADAAFRLVPRKSGVDVRVVTLDGKARQLSRGTALAARVPGADRDLSVATWQPGKLPALFVIDHGQARERVSVAIFSGESAFRTRIATFKLPVRGLPGRDWSLSIGRGIGNRPNLVAVARAGSSHHPEVHVVSGDSNFQRFVAQYVVGLPPLGRDAAVGLGATLGLPAVYLLDRDRSELRIVAYATTPVAAIAPPS